MNTADSHLISDNKQQCSVTGLYRIWLGYVAGLAVFTYSRNWIGLGIWAILVPLAKWVHIRFYSRFSRFSGYGAVDDQLPATAPKAAGPVTYYSAIGCPFCPIVLQRLKALQKEMGFKLETVDVSFHPNFLAKHGIRSVPVVEAGGNRVVGNATSEQLARLISLPPALVAAN